MTILPFVYLLIDVKVIGKCFFYLLFLKERLDVELKNV